MAVDYAKKIGFKGQFLIEPKPKEPTKHQYDFDVASGIAFLRTYGLERHFKFNIETNHATLAGHTFQHEIEVAAAPMGMLGSIDANRRRRTARLGHGPVPDEHLRDDDGDVHDPARRRVHDGRAELRRQGAPPSSDPTDLFPPRGAAGAGGVPTPGGPGPANGEPALQSGRQELLENILNSYIR